MRTTLQALEYVLSEFDAGRLGAMSDCGICIYDDGNGKHCSVGCLFNQAQLDDIKKRGLNVDSNVVTLAWYIGEKNIETVTGLSIEFLKQMQNKHDEAFSVFLKDSYGEKFKHWLLDTIELLKAARVK